MTKWTAISAGTILAVASACNAGWLHQAYQGSFCAHKHQYVVTNEGYIQVQTMMVPPGMYYNGQTPEPIWTTEIAFNNLNDLDNVIGDLQKVSKEMHKQWGDAPVTACDTLKDCGK